MKQLSLLLTLFFVSQIFAQSPSESPRNRDDYYKMAEDIMKKSDVDYLKYRFETDVYEFFYSGEVMEAELAFLYDCTDKLIENRAFGYPAIRQLIEGFKALEEEKLGGDKAAAKEAFFEALDWRSSSDRKKFLECIGRWGEIGAFAGNRTLNWKVVSGYAQLMNEGKEVFINFEGADLKALSKGDSSLLYACNGKYDVEGNKLILDKGRISWEKAGLDVTRNYADFFNAEIKAKSSYFDLDSCIVTSQFLPEQKYGRVKEKILTAGGARVRYPAFESTKSSITITDILPDVDYTGGFAIRGARFEGYNSPDKPGIIKLKHQGRVVLKALASQVQLDSAKITAVPAQVVINIGEDSIYHPGASFKYFADDEKMEVIRHKDGVGEAPFYSSYHKMDFYVQSLKWVKGQNQMMFGSLFGENTTKATFESANFFDMERYYAITGAQNRAFNALAKLAMQGGYAVSIKKYAQYAGMTEDEAVYNSISFANKGFIYYNVESGQILIKEKLYDFMQAAANKIDYDNIYFESNVENPSKPNAAINLDNFDLEIYGIKMVNISDSQAVAMYADKNTEKLTVKKGLDMEFAGVVRAGNLDFYGDSIFFNYEKYNIDLGKVDSVAVNVLAKSANGKYRYVLVRTMIQDVVGELQIDEPNNKRGKDAYKSKYPTLNSKEDSYVYYDKKSIQNGAYTKEKLNFKIYPFILDSLDKISKEGFALQGELFTDGTFPVIKDTLKITDDYSLGIEYTTPPEGLPMYGGLATFKNDIKLSETTGLEGSGEIKFITSTLNSNRFTIQPDSCFGVAQTIANEKRLGNPSVPVFNGVDYTFALNKQKEELSTTTLKDLFTLYDGETTFEGTMKLSEKDLMGDGKLSLKGGTVESKALRIATNIASADKSKFSLKDIDGVSIAFAVEDVNTVINYDTKIAEFKANDPTTAVVDFPKNQYKAFMDTYKWMMDDNQIAVNSSITPNEEDPKDFRSHLLSVNKDQDSLRFVAPNAIFDIAESTIKAEKVKRIRTGDAWVIPDKGQVNILPKARIEALQNANIIADYVNQFHTIFEATVEIVGRKKYLGRGKYDYVDEFGEKQQIFFEDISVVEGQTVAAGDIPEDQNFKLNAYFDYKGKAQLKAKEKGLSFNGTTRIKSTCENIPNNWLVFEGQVDPKDARIPVGKEMKSDIGKQLSVGLTINNTTDELYPTFLSEKNSSKDGTLISAEGFLWYSADDKSYKVGSVERSKGESIGNLISLNTSTCDVTGEGMHNFGIDLGQVDASLYGKSKYKNSTGVATLKGAVRLDFYLDKKFLEIIGTKFKEDAFLQPAALYDSEFNAALNVWLDDKKAKKAQEELNTQGTLNKVPDELEVPFVFADVSMKWDSNLTSFVSDNTMDLGIILKDQIYAKVRSKMQVMKSKRGNELNLYLEQDPKNWFYFRYKQDVNPRMQVYSPVEGYMSIFEEIKEADRELKTKKDEAKYKFEPGSSSAKAIFFERFE